MFVKRALYSMKYRKGQNIALTIAYTLLFALTLAILLVYLSMDAQVDSLQRSLGCAVTLRTNIISAGLYEEGALRYFDVKAEDADVFIDSPYVESYNKVGWLWFADFEGGLLPVVRDENLGMYEYQTMNGTGRTLGYLGDCAMTPVTRSEDYDAFTVYGFSLVEGRHFTEKDSAAAIISTQLAERNGLKIGDQISFSTCLAGKRMARSEELYQYATLTICGLMEVPDAQEMGYDTGCVFYDPYNFVIASYDVAATLTNVYADPPTPGLQSVTVYLRSPEDTEAFVRETQEKFKIDGVKGTVSDFGMEVDTQEGMKSIQDRYERFIAGDISYTLFLDNEWYDMVAKPVESVRNLLGMFLAVVLLGSAVVLVLVVVLSLRGRKREFGILMSMGEPKGKIIAQIFAEVFTPMLLAAVLGALLGTLVLVPAAEDYSSQLLSTQSREEQTDLRAGGMKDSDYFYMEEIRRFIDDLRHRSPRTMVVVKSVPYAAGPEACAAYFGLDFAMVVLILLMQLLSVLRVKPARILTGRE